MSPSAQTKQTIQQLAERLRAMEGAHRPAEAASISSGIEPLDRMLPEGGFHRGTLVEWLSAGDGAGAGTLALMAARAACREGGPLVVIDPRGEFYPPAAAGQGIELEQLFVVHPGRAEEAIWALDQSLRCTGVSAALGWIGPLDDRTFRRLQLATEAGAGLGLLLRPAALRVEPSWAEVRLLVESSTRIASDAAQSISRRACPANLAPPASPRRRRVRVKLLRCPGNAQGTALELDIDDETHTVHLASELAPSAPLRRPAGA
jgi:protein ImuA